MTITPPQENIGDKVTKLTKALIETIPGAAVCTELLTWFIKLPLQRRLEKWQQEVSDTLNELKEKGIDFEKLQNNEEFFDILLQAIQIGIRNHQEEKRQFLKNAILKSAVQTDIDFTKNQIFLNYIDELTVPHISLLILMNNPLKWFKKNKDDFIEHDITEVFDVVKNAHPIWEDEFVSLLWDDLYNKKLLNKYITTLSSPAGLQESKTTNLGKEFIDYITQ